MGIGAGILLIAVGAVLAFAVNATVAGVDIVTIGVILMIAGAAGIALDLAIFAPRRRGTVVRTSSAAYASNVAPVAPVAPVAGAMPGTPAVPVIPVAPVTPTGRRTVVETRDY